jgi:hypothetical protein
MRECRGGKPKAAVSRCSCCLAGLPCPELRPSPCTHGHATASLAPASPCACATLTTAKTRGLLQKVRNKETQSTPLLSLKHRCTQPQNYQGRLCSHPPCASSRVTDTCAMEHWPMRQRKARCPAPRRGQCSKRSNSRRKPSSEWLRSCRTQQRVVQMDQDTYGAELCTNRAWRLLQP